MKFMCDLYSLAEANVVAFGVPFGKDGKKVLRALREASDLIEPFDLDRKENIFDGIRLTDIGNLKLKRLEEITKKCEYLLKLKKLPLILARGHLTTLFSLKAFDEKIRVVVFDAHCDLKDKYLDETMSSFYKSFVKSKDLVRLNGATWLRRFCEERTNKIMLIGVRSCDEDEFEFLRERKIQYITPDQLRKNVAKIKRKISEFTKSQRIYISIDIDVFDPSIAPAVEYPEPDGLFFKDFKEIIHLIKGKFVGMDLNLHRTIKKNNITEFLASKAVLEALKLFSSD